MSLFPKITCTVSLIGLICLFLMKFTTLFFHPLQQKPKKKQFYFLDTLSVLTEVQFDSIFS